MDASEPFRLRRALLCAVLWCAIITIAESMEEPVGEVDLHEQISFIMLVGCNYIVPGLIWSVGTELPASRRHPLLSAVMLLSLATAASVLTAWMLCPLFSYSSGMGEILFRPPMQGFAGHAFWSNSFYGGMFAAAYHFNRKNFDLSRRLAALRLALGQSEMRLREARLTSLQEQLRPTILMQALQALQMHYIQDPVSGDRLFNALVAFLRLAMPGLRGHPHSGPTGKSLIEGYAGLRNAIDPTVLRWRVADDAWPATATPAPRCLLAVLDGVDGAVPDRWTIDVTACGSATEYAVRIWAAVELEPAELCRLLDTLRELDARATARPVSGTSLEIVLPVPPMSDGPKPAAEATGLPHEGGEHVANLAQNYTHRSTLADEPARAGAGCGTGPAAQLPRGAG